MDAERASLRERGARARRARAGFRGSIGRSSALLRPPPRCRGISSAVRRPVAVLGACAVVISATAIGLALRPPPPEPLRAMRGVALWAERARTLGDEEV